MRTVELAKVAAAAEALRLRRIVHRQTMRAVFGAGAAVFAIAVFVLLHVLAYELLVREVTPVVDSLILLAFDLIVAGGLAYLALGNKPDAIEDEALQVRQQAVVEMRQSLTVMALAGEVTGLVLRRRPKADSNTRPRGNVRLLGEIAARVLSRR
jgi:hypothetical protein